MKTQREILGENLERLIDRRGIDQKILAEKIGVSDMTVSNWVRGLKYPRIDKLQDLADYFGIKHADLVTEQKSHTLNEAQSSYVTRNEAEYDFYPISISAGLPSIVDSVTEENIQQITLPNIIMGKWARHEDVFVTKVNGDSMNKIIPDQSLIAVKKICLENLKNDDIVVFSDEHEYSVKRYYNDTENKKIIFSPDSTDRRFTDYSISYENAKNITIHGKVVVYIVELD